MNQNENIIEIKDLCKSFDGTKVLKNITFYKNKMGENTPILIDSHQHTHMIPVICKALLRAPKKHIAEMYFRRQT